MDTWTPAPILPEQYRAARALLGLAEQALADSAGVTLGQLQALEAEQPVTEAVALAVRRALEAAGAHFINQGVMRLPKPPQKTPEEKMAAVRRIQEEVAKLPVLDPRPWREIRDSFYDKNGIPT